MIEILSIEPQQGQGFARVRLAEEESEGVPSIYISTLISGDMWGGEEADRNREAFFTKVGIDPERVRSLEQIHSRRVVEAEEIHGRVDADGMISRDRSLVLAVRVADCYPIFLFDRALGVFAATHSGWRGTGIAGLALDRMRVRYGTDPRDVAAVLGPGIRRCCYDVPQERAAFFRGEFGKNSVVERDGKEFLDLAAANISLLSKRGVESITSIVDCTSCSPFLGSFRREGPQE
ncbi:MAG TPA: polyphenol oxidase family protein, partial [Spirochaetia bacterium]|nr:polyphenol oxidase family protein [Spirochaetia bacterium]